MKIANKGIVMMTTTDLLRLPYQDVISRIQTGEWGLEQFTRWADDNKDYQWGDGYEEGYETAERAEYLHRLH